MLNNKCLNTNLTSVIVKLKLPTNSFEIYALNNDPMSLQAELALEYKALFYKNIGFKIRTIDNYLNTDYEFLRILESRHSYYEFPYMKMTSSYSTEATFSSGINEIYKILDTCYPNNSLLQREHEVKGLEISILGDWINKAFLLPFLSLMFFNEHNFSNVIGHMSTFSKMNVIRKTKYNKVLTGHPDKRIAYEKAYQTLNEEVIPMCIERLNFSYNNGLKFLVDDEPCFADFVLYSYLKLMKNFAEETLVKKSQFERFTKSIEEKMPLDLKKHHEKVEYTRNKLNIINNYPKEEVLSRYIKSNES